MANFPNVHGPQTRVVYARNPVTLAWEIRRATTRSRFNPTVQPGDNLPATPSTYKGLIRQMAREHVIPGGGASWVYAEYITPDLLTGYRQLGPPAMTGGVSQQMDHAIVDQTGSVIVDKATEQLYRTQGSTGLPEYERRMYTVWDLYVVTLTNGTLNASGVDDRVDKANTTTVFGLGVDRVKYLGPGNFQAWLVDGTPVFFMRHHYQYTRGPAAEAGVDGWWTWKVNRKDGKALLARNASGTANINLTTVIGL